MRLVWPPPPPPRVILATSRGFTSASPILIVVGSIMCILPIPRLSAQRAFRCACCWTFLDAGTKKKVLLAGRIIGCAGAKYSLVPTTAAFPPYLLLGLVALQVRQ